MPPEGVELVLLRVVPADGVAEPELAPLLELIQQLGQSRVRLVEDHLLLLVECLDRGVDKRVAGLLFGDCLGVVRVHLASTQPLAAFSGRPLRLVVGGSDRSSDGGVRGDGCIAARRHSRGGRRRRARVGCSVGRTGHRVGGDRRGCRTVCERIGGRRGRSVRHGAVAGIIQHGRRSRCVRRVGCRLCRWSRCRWRLQLGADGERVVVDGRLALAAEHKHDLLRFHRGICLDGGILCGRFLCVPLLLLLRLLLLVAGMSFL